MSVVKKAQAPNSYVVLDFETGGLNNRNNPITEIAFVTLDGETLEEMDRYEALIHPYDDALEYDQKALDYTHITMDMLYEEGKDIDQVWKECCNLFERANVSGGKRSQVKPILVGHNIVFDAGFMHHFFYHGQNKIKSYQDALEKLFKGQYIQSMTSDEKMFFINYLDTLDVTKAWMQSENPLSSYTLSAISSELHIDLNNAHRAMNDIITTAEALRINLNRLRNGQQGGGGTSIRNNFKFQM